MCIFFIRCIIQNETRAANLYYKAIIAEILQKY